MRNKKGQVSLGDAPQIVMIVGLVFLLMATLAYIGYQYQQGFGAPLTATVVNESVGYASIPGHSVAGSSSCNAQSFTMTQVLNHSSGLAIASGNYTFTTAGKITNLTGEYNAGSWDLTYAYKYAGADCNITQALGTQLNNNTSIAGIVLTIALVGIVLSVLIGVFVLVGRRKV